MQKSVRAVLATALLAMFASLVPASLAIDEPDPSGRIVMSCLAWSLEADGVSRQNRDWELYVDQGDAQNHILVSADVGSTFHATYNGPSYVWGAYLYADGVLVDEQHCPNH